jgi:hypothetical protein
MSFPHSLFHTRTGAVGAVLALVLSAGGAAGCAAVRPAALPPDEQFGHRPGAAEDGGRLTLAITPPDTTVRYFYYPAVFDTVHVRPAPFDGARPVDAQQVAVEVLVKGALPDACSELHTVRQERFGHIVEVRLEMRRPQGAVCASVVRPYRFYLMLDGGYGAGAYTLKLNDRPVAFVVGTPGPDTPP